MKKLKILSLLLVIWGAFQLVSCDSINDFLSDDETIAGLKQALAFSTDTTVNQAGVMNGFYQNAAIKILFPEEAQGILNLVNSNPIAATLMGSLTETFVERMNRAAEEATPLAKDIFIETISNITFSDAAAILNGGDYAATNFLENNARPALYNAFKPIVEDKISAVGADDIWNQVTTIYNQFSQNPVNTDINDYVTQKALDGIFKLIGEEEQKIRQDPLHRVTALLQKVFG